MQQGLFKEWSQKQLLQRLQERFLQPQLQGQNSCAEKREGQPFEGRPKTRRMGMSAMRTKACHKATGRHVKRVSSNAHMTSKASSPADNANKCWAEAAEVAFSPGPDKSSALPRELPVKDSTKTGSQIACYKSAIAALPEGSTLKEN